ncbi:MAG: hypothetical protein HYX71_00110 [Opitutae bacterium]|nr:hypothetical protein [Opitutae bacterium]
MSAQLLDHVTISWPYLLLAVAMLWFPRQWLRNGARVLKKRRRPDGALERLAGMGARDPDDKSVQPGKEFANFRNYVDLFRALAGGYSLTQFAFAARDGDAELAVFLVQAAILLVAVLSQTIRLGERLSFFAPIFFLVGLSVGASGHYAGLLAFILVLAINPIIPNPRLFLTAYGLLLLAFGYFLDADMKLLGVNAALILLPPLLSLLAKRPLVIFTRKAKSATPS